MKKISLVIFLLFSCAPDHARSEAFSWLDQYYGENRGPLGVTCDSEGLCIVTSPTGQNLVLSCPVSACSDRQNGCLLILENPR